jgi:hypothetical protein
MPTTQANTDISKMITNVGTMTTQNIKNINSYEDLRDKLINFGPKFTNDGDEKISITNYYKIGNNPVQTVTYANNEIKTLVVNNMIPYCETYYDSYKEEIKKALTNLKTSLENIHKTYVTESLNDVDLLGSIFTEAETPAQPTQQPAQTQPNITEVKQTTSTNDVKPDEKSGTSNISTKAGWITKCVQSYSGCVLNAIRDRNNDYFKALYGLIPKTAPAPKSTTPQAQPVQAEQPAQTT